MKEMFGDVRLNTTMCECDFLVISQRGWYPLWGIYIDIYLASAFLKHLLCTCPFMRFSAQWKQFINNVFKTLGGCLGNFISVIG